MKQHQGYHGFWLEGEVGNNAFAYQARLAEGLGSPRLWVPPRRKGGALDARIGNQIVFAETHETGQCEKYVGLESFVDFVYVSSTGREVPGVLFDNHNHAFYFWHEAKEKGILTATSHVVHIDAHTDLRTPPLLLSQEDSTLLEKVFQYTNDVLNVGNFLVPAMETGCIAPDVTMITTEYELLRKTPETLAWDGTLIVDIDLDFWEKSLVDTTLDVSLPLVRAWMEQANFLTLCTSPFFIDQERALLVANQLLLEERYAVGE